MTSPSAVPPRGRHREARRNDEAVIAAARDIFAENPYATMSDVATRAGVGQASLYRRYRTKDELLNAVCASGMQTVATAAEVALLDNGDSWETFTNFMVRYAESGAGTQLFLAGSFESTEHVHVLAARVHHLTQQVVDRAIHAGVLRDDVTGADIPLLSAQLASLRSPDRQRDLELRHRYFALTLDGLRAPAHSPLPARAPDFAELDARWRVRNDKNT